MSSFTSGYSDWYCFAAASRVESTQTVNAQSFCAAWAKPSLLVVALVPLPEADTVSSTVAAQAASSAGRLMLGTVLPVEVLTDMSDSTGFAGAPSDREGGAWMG